jgi:hypothetical protein
MKLNVLIALSLALCIFGCWRMRDYTWTPADAPRWNPMAMKESGFGRTLARALTEEANTSYHHGLFERKPPLSTNPLSGWLDRGNTALGFQGRLRYRPVEQYPLRPYEVRQALDQVEKNLRLAFELDPGNYTAYDVYFFFLTNEVTQTEFASMSGAQLKDDDDDQEDATAAGGAPAPENAAVAKPADDHSGNGPTKQQGSLQRWAEQERERRKTRAIEITGEAIRKFRPNTMDPERFLTAAVMWYDRVMLLAPDPKERRKSVAARIKFAEVVPPALGKITYYLDAASACQRSLEEKGLWQAIPERRAEFLRLQKLIDKCAFTLSAALQDNLSQLQKGRPAKSIWGPLGQN